MPWLINLLAFLLTTTLLVFVHEFGHYWVAKRCGVKVLRFSIGFGKPLWRWRNTAGTEFVVCAIALGGYVKMLDDSQGPVLPQEQHRAFNHQSLPKRIAIVAAGPLSNFLLAIAAYTLIFSVGFTHLIPVVHTVVPGSRAEQGGLLPGMTIVAIEDRAVYTWQEIQTQWLAHATSTSPVSVTVQVANEHSLRTLLIPAGTTQSADVLTAVGIEPQLPRIPPVLGPVQSGQAASRAGLLEGDRVLHINDIPVTAWSTLVGIIQAHPHQPVSIHIERHGLTYVYLLTPDANAAGQGVIGVQLQTPQPHDEGVSRTQLPLNHAFYKAIRQTVDYSMLTIGMLKHMVLGQTSVDQLSGPISIAQGAGQSAHLGWMAFLNFLALISISLGVLNSLPIPMLDGGHILFYMIEACRGQPLSKPIQQLGLQVGMLMLLVVMSVAFYNDVLRLL